MDISGLLGYTVGSDAIQDYTNAIVVFLVALIILRFFKFVVISRLKKITQKTKTGIDDVLVNVVDQIGWFFYVLLSIYLSLLFVPHPQLLDQVMYYALLISITYYAVRAVQQIIDYAERKFIREREKEAGETDSSLVHLMTQIVKAVLWLIALLLIISNAGIDISPMLAGLGIGGLAVAFALQNVLSDVFASFSIYFDKPFKVGDTILIGTDLGEVKRVGIKTTRILTQQGQELVVSNRELTETRIHNFKKMTKRRVVFSFGIEYETPTKQVKAIPKMVEDIVKCVELVDFDRVHFSKFGDSALLFEVVYFVKTNDYKKYMDIQQDINLAIKEEFEKEGIAMAYPTQTLYINKLKQIK
ncbi:MAG: mechanosensitive ion channel family protein [Candidatus Micrarchaeota archaeon]